MSILLNETLSTYRAHTFRTAANLRITTIDQAVELINQRGFIFFWPTKGQVFPNLWAAAAGDRPVPDEHDDPGHVTWDWKDKLLDKKLVFYARVLRKRNTFISLDMLPYFYALSPNYGEPEEDYLIDYEQGQLTVEARQVYEALLNNGPLDTVALRKESRLASRTSDGPFNRALETLQTTFRILPIGVAQAGAWNYAFIYDLVPRHFPWIIEQAHPISETTARQKLLERYMQSLGAARLVDAGRFFGWPAALAERTAQHLVDQGLLLRSVELEGVKGEGLCLPELMPGLSL